VRALADGSSLLGEAALQNGLIDKIGGLFEAESYIKDKIQDEVNMCW
jgi:ClpP class serine protease